MRLAADAALPWPPGAGNWKRKGGTLVAATRKAREYETLVRLTAGRSRRVPRIPGQVDVVALCIPRDGRSRKLDGPARLALRILCESAAWHVVIRQVETFRAVMAGVDGCGRGRIVLRAVQREEGR